MTRSRLPLAAAALAVCGLAAVAGPATADPRCDGAAAGAVHTAHETAEAVPVAGGPVSDATHGAEGVACALPR